MTSVAFSSDGQRVVTGSHDQTARVWDAITGGCVRVLSGHSDLVTCVAFSTDGKRVVTGSDDETARVWNAATGQLMQELKGHHARVLSVAFSPDGTRVVTGLSDRSTRVWDATTGNCEITLQGQAEAADSTEFSRDGKRIVTRSSGQQVRVWDATDGRPVDEPVPATAKGDGVLPDGRLIIPYGFGPVIVDPRVNPEYIARWRHQARDLPRYHADLATQYQNDPFAAAVQLSLEQQARGRLAIEDLDFDKAARHFLAAMLLKPKPYQWPAK